MSMGWTILNGTLTDWNLYWLVSGELQTRATKQLEVFQMDVQTQEECLTAKRESILDGIDQVLFC